MSKKRPVRTIGVALTALLLAAGIMSPAEAANKRLSSPYGYIEHIDDGDRFKVRDTNANGHAVIGYLYDGITLKGSADDGGDSGSDYFTHNITWGTYTMKLCPKSGPGSCVTTSLKE